ncbi:condensation domain-containing protein [Streptomyces sp. NPDC002328]|uniref:condensation domain-containing protein n=1 Tax=Streptomyces sp. NPDC002328 TaxID=3364642 RepID=UPI003694AA15
MAAGHSSSVPPKALPRERPLSVVIDLGSPPYDAAVLELDGPLAPDLLRAAFDRAAADRENAAWRPRVRRHGPARHTVRLTAHDASGLRAPPAGLLADLLTRTPAAALPARSAPATPLQRELLADAEAHPGAGRQVGQLTWNWYGPFHLERFTAAWQSVSEREAVLRAAFGEGPEPPVVLHDGATAEVEPVPRGGEPWHALVARDLRRGIDPRAPGPLRVTVLDARPPVTAADRGTPSARVLLTYHHALLDDFSVHLLLREVCRAYLAGGRLPGGDRRPDFPDYAGRLAHRDLGAARDFWRRTLPPAAPGARPPHPVPAAPGPAALADSATGRTRARLTRAQTDRLGSWAAAWGGTESLVLQAVWALLLYRERGAQGAAAVRFSVTVSGRGVPFEGVELLPGALRSPLPLSVTVDPRVAVPDLLAQLRDKAVDMAAYEWVSAGQVRSWTGEHHGAGDSLVVFDRRPRMPDDLVSQCAAQGIRLGRPELLGARTAFPVTLVADHGGDGGLVLTATCEAGRLARTAAAVASGAVLLRVFPDVADGCTTVGEVLDLLAAVAGTAGAAVTAPVLPDRAAPRAAAPEPPLVTLRPAARPGAGAVCLVRTGGVPRSRYDRVARVYAGPQAVVLLRPPAGGESGRRTALRRLPGGGGPLALGAFSGGGAAACETARLVAADGGRPPLVVITGGTDGVLLARMLQAAAERVR